MCEYAFRDIQPILLCLNIVSQLFFYVFAFKLGFKLKLAKVMNGVSLSILHLVCQQIKLDKINFIF